MSTNRTSLAVGTWAVAVRILLESWRRRRTLLFWVIFPSLMLLLFGSIYAGGGRGSRASFDETAPGILTGAALFFSCLSGPVSVVVAERERRTLRRVLLAPVPRLAYPLGVLAAFTVVAAGQTAIVYGIAFLFGGRFHGAIWLGALIVLLSVACYALLGFVLGARLARRAEDVNGPVSAIGVPLLVLGGTFFPPQFLPPFLRSANVVNPIFHMNEALRAVWARGESFDMVAGHVLALVVIALVFLFLTAHSYRALLREGNAP
jgi:ABC-2 type transport system permease protein